jgi:hypothetical protein
MSKMPIAATLLNGGAMSYIGRTLAAVRQLKEQVVPPPQEQVVHIQPVEPDTQAAALDSLHNVVPFNVQVAADLYWGNKKDYYVLEEFEPLRMPYPHMWMEWYIPREGYLLGERYAFDHIPVHCAAYLREDDASDISGAEKLITAQFLAFTGGMVSVTGLQPVALNELSLSFAVDHDGRLVRGSCVELYPKGSLPPEIVGPLRSEALSNLYVCAMALNLINCRNVTHAPAGAIPHRRSGSAKRRGEAPIKFRTIVLPGMTVERSNTSRRQREANAAVLRQHMVRGHFKRFTPEAPLLGKHVGTYWWNPAVRGNAKRGQVVQDYRLGEPTTTVGEQQL